MPPYSIKIFPGGLPAVLSLHSITIECCRTLAHKGAGGKFGLEGGRGIGQDNGDKNVGCSECEEPMSAQK